MSDNDSRLIWESLQPATNPVSEADNEDPRYAQLIQFFMQNDGASRQEAMQMAKETIRKMNAKKLPVKHESSPGRVSGSNIPFPDGRGEHQDAMWSSEGVEEMEPMELLDLIQDRLPNALTQPAAKSIIHSLQQIARQLISDSEL